LLVDAKVIKSFLKEPAHIPRNVKIVIRVSERVVPPAFGLRVHTEKTALGSDARCYGSGPEKSHICNGKRVIADL
jgi:hypothetical protein